MNLLDLLVYIWIIMTLGYLFTSRERNRGRRYVRVHNTDIGPPPVIPEPRYICENCGMTIHTGHGHTREECDDYTEDPTKPDGRAHRTMLPGRNDPKVTAPYYYEVGAFRNWGRGK